jgi:hypothetical protein
MLLDQTLLSTPALLLSVRPDRAIGLAGNRIELGED